MSGQEKNIEHPLQLLMQAIYAYAVTQNEENKKQIIASLPSEHISRIKVLKHILCWFDASIVEIIWSQIKTEITEAECFDLIMFAIISGEDCFATAAKFITDFFGTGADVSISATAITRIIQTLTTNPADHIDIALFLNSPACEAFKRILPPSENPTLWPSPPNNGELLHTYIEWDHFENFQELLNNLKLNSKRLQKTLNYEKYGRTVPQHALQAGKDNFISVLGINAIYLTELTPKIIAKHGLQGFYLEVVKALQTISTVNHESLIEKIKKQDKSKLIEKSIGGITLLHYFVSLDLIELAATLLECVPELLTWKAQFDNDIFSALDVAIHNNCPRSALFLLEKGATFKNEKQKLTLIGQALKQNDKILQIKLTEVFKNNNETALLLYGVTLLNSHHYFPINFIYTTQLIATISDIELEATNKKFIASSKKDILNFILTSQIITDKHYWIALFLLEKKPITLTSTEEFSTKIIATKNISLIKKTLATFKKRNFLLPYLLSQIIIAKLATELEILTYLRSWSDIEWKKILKDGFDSQIGFLKEEYAHILVFLKTNQVSTLTQDWNLLITTANTHPKKFANWLNSSDTSVTRSSSQKIAKKTQIAESSQAPLPIIAPSPVGLNKALTPNITFSTNDPVLDFIETQLKFIFQNPVTPINQLSKPLTNLARAYPELKTLIKLIHVKLNQKVTTETFSATSYAKFTRPKEILFLNLIRSTVTAYTCIQQNATAEASKAFGEIILNFKQLGENFEKHQGLYVIPVLELYHQELSAPAATLSKTI